MGNFIKYVCAYFTQKKVIDKIPVLKVFVSSGVPLYTRIDIDEHNKRFKTFIESPNEHLLIHGPSKSGKSTLWSSFLGESAVIKIPCTDEMTMNELYEEIVDELDVYFRKEKSIEETVKQQFQEELKSKYIGLKYSLEHSDKKTDKDERLVKPVLSSRNLQKFIKATGKYILLENIHYSSQELKAELSKELHNFSDYQCKWILVGVQHQADQIFLENRDLIGRLREIPTGIFEKDQIFQIISKGEEKLNIRFTIELKDSVFNESYGISALAQDICRYLCINCGVTETQETAKTLDYNKNVFEQTCREIANSNRQAYVQFVNDIKKGGRSDGSTLKYFWFLKVIQTVDFPKEGMYNTEMLHEINKLGCLDIHQTSVTQGLQYLNTLQKKKSINPPVLEYDETKRKLFILDPYFRFVLRWSNILEN